MARPSRTSGDASGCLDDLVVANIVAARNAELEPHVAQHLAECADCRANVAGALAALRSPDIAREIARLEAKHSQQGGRWTRIAALAAVLAAVALFPQLLRSRSDAAPDAPDQLRDPHAGITMTSPPVILSPKGSIARVQVLAWTNVSGATRYDVTVYDKEGGVVWTAETTDTTVALPARVVLTQGNVYLWKVAAHTSLNRSTESELVEFVVQRPAR